MGFAAARVRVPVAAGAAEIVIAAPVSALAADDMALMAMFMACMALDIVLVAVFIACIAVDMVFADEVALVAAAAIWVADEATFTAAEDTVLAAAPVVRMLFAPWPRPALAGRRSPSRWSWFSHYWRHSWPYCCESLWYARSPRICG